MLLDVLPLRAILFQLLFLTVAIAIEAAILQKRLDLSPRTSVEYAASMNLLSTVIGWLLFFNLEALLPSPLRAQLISFILFDHFLASSGSYSMNTLLTLGALVTFFGTFLLELKGLDLLEILLQVQQSQPHQEAPPYREPGGGSASHRLFRQEVASINRSRAATILLANACSYSAILLLLLSRFLAPESIFL